MGIEESVPRSAEPPAAPGREERLRKENEQLQLAMETRPVIDQARGMVMALVPCSSEEAWDLLVDISQHCNVKLRDLAEALVATTTGRPLPPGMQEQVCRTFRHHAERRPASGRQPRIPRIRR